MEKEKDITQLIAVLKECVFALETVAHLRGLEGELLPYANKARTVMAQFDTTKKEGN